jgi:hypothetical protein
MRLKLAVATLGAFVVIGGSAEARLLPSYPAESYIRSDGRELAREAPWAIGPELGKCARPSLSRYECQVKLEGRRPIGYSVSTGTEYEAGFCSWVGVAHYRSRYSVVVNRRELGCETWIEYSR